MPSHTTRKPVRSCTRLCRVLLVFVCLGMSGLRADALEIAVNPNNGINALSRQELLAIFTMRQRIWADGTPITVFIVDQNSDLHARFCKELLRVFPHQLRTIWDRLVYSGSGTAPISVKSEQVLVEKLAATPGGIGYVESADSGSSIKIIDVSTPGPSVPR